MMQLAQRWRIALPITAQMSPAHLTLCGWFIFCTGLLFAPDKHELRLLFNWLLAVPSLIWFSVQRPRIDWREPIFLTTAVCATYFAASAAWGADDHAVLLKSVKVSLSLLWFFAVTRALIQRWQQLPEALLTLLPLFGGVAALLSLAHYAQILEATQWHALFTTLFENNSLSAAAGLLPRLRGWGILQNELVVASVLGGCALIAADRYYRAEALNKKLVYAVSMVLCTLVVVLSQSRGPLLLLIACCAAVVRLHCTQSRNHALLLILLGVTLLPLLFSEALLLSLQQRGANFSFRDQIWLQIWREMPGHWLFGQGLRLDHSVMTEAGVFPHGHNIAMELLRFGGVAGLALFCGIFYRLFALRSRLHTNVRDMLTIWCMFGLGCQLLNGSFPFSHPSYGWFLLWLPVALMAGSASSHTPAIIHAASRASP